MWLASALDPTLRRLIWQPKLSARLSSISCESANLPNGFLANSKVFAVLLFYRHNVLKQKDSIEDGLGLPDFRLMACLGVCYLLLFVTMCKGVQSSGKAAYFNALFPYAVLITLLVKGATLPGAIEGILYYITPQWSALLDVKAILLIAQILCLPCCEMISMLH